MTQINLYKIHEDERELFIKSIARKYRICAQKILDGMVYRLCNGAKKTTSSFDVNELIAFWNESNIESATQKLQTKVGFWLNGRRTHTRPLHDLIDFTMKERCCSILVNGTNITTTSYYT